MQHTPFSRISNLCFSVDGVNEIITESYVDVRNKEIMKGNLPMPDGIYDPHMGTTDYSWDCLTCGNKKAICPGHYGSMDLKYPVKSPLYRDELLKWLKIICYYCGNIVVTIKKNIPNNEILSFLVKNARAVKKCSVCDKKHLHVIKDKKKPAVFYRIDESNIKNIKLNQFYNHQIQEVLDRLSDESVIKLGKPLRSHPRKFILKTIRVPPNTIRPDIRRIGGARSSNPDSTSLLKTIKEINEALPEEIPPNEQIIKELDEMYFNLDMTYFAMIKGGGGGEVKFVTNTNKPPVAIAEHWAKKEGRIRMNLMGKRTNYMIRSVITGDSLIKIDEVGISQSHAMSIEIPETVSQKNIKRLSTYFYNGANRYPGCKRIIKKSDGYTYRIEHMDEKYILQEGDIIMRDMIDGDPVLLNRQPSLFFASIQGLKAVIMDSSDNIRLNPAVCNGFNADFDGDNMNIIIPQNIMARTEVNNISKAHRWFLSLKDQTPLAGAFYDCLIGLSEFTNSGVYFDKWHAMELFNNIYSDNTNFNFREKKYTNRELISRLLPEINLINKKPSMYKEQYHGLLKYNKDDINIIIKRGKLQSGILDKNTTGQNKKGSIFHIIAKEYGNEFALKTIYNFQQIIHNFLIYSGFTCGIHDINIPKESRLEIKNKISKMIIEAKENTDKLNRGKLIPPLGISLNDFYESEQMNILTSGDDFINPILSGIDLYNNGLTKLVLSGSKGKLLNYIAINGSIGSQTIDGKRFKRQAGWGRTSPYFTRYSTEPESNGYISMCYRSGIDSIVYPFIAAEGRHGQISNALKTRVTGYQNRISVKNVETTIVDNLRKSMKKNNIVQPLYADCGLDTSKMEKVKFLTVLCSMDELKNNFKTKLNDIEKKYRNKKIEQLLEEEFKQIINDRESYRTINLHLENFEPGNFIMENTFILPVNTARIIDDVYYNYSDMVNELKNDEKTLDPEYVINTVKKIM